jgi:2-C-methyl-D-erythritol 4-phosphate cytidylyltransferase
VEQLEQGTARRPRSTRTLVVLIVGALSVGLVLAVGLVIDARWRDAAAESLTVAFDQTVTAIETGERRVQSVAEYGRQSSSGNDAARAAAIESSAEIAQRRANIDGVLLLPWHDDLRNAREQALLWLDLRATGVNSYAAQGIARYPPRGELNDARAALVRAFSVLR